MNKEDLIEYEERVSKFNAEEKKEHDLYLKRLALGEIQGPKTGIASIDKPWLKHYSDADIVADLPNMSMKKYLFECNQNNSDRTAINYYGHKISYLNLINHIESSKKSFDSIGVKKGDVVSIAAPFIPETVYSIYALNALGAVVNLVDPRVPSDKLLDYFKGSNTKYAVVFNSIYPKMKVIEDESNIEKTILMSPTDSLPIGMKILGKVKEKFNDNKVEENDKYENWSTFISRSKKVGYVPDAAYEKGNPAVIVYTSGTSGEPKGAISSNESFNYMAFNQNVCLKERGGVGDKFLLIMPPFIAYGVAIGMHGQLCRGQELIMIPSFNIDNQKEMLGNLVAKYKPQTIMGVPAFMVDLIKHPKMKDLDCEFLKTIIVGGDSMIPSAEEKVNKFFEAKKSEARICKGWGLTEVNSAATYTKDAETNKIGSVGAPLICNNIKIVKPVESDNIDIDELEELGYNETGEIFINSKTEIIDYLNNKEESNRVFYTSKRTGERWIRTKDLGRITEDGLIYIDGRMKRIIIRPDGHNISPFAIEHIINSDSQVESCAVVGRPSKENEHGSYAVAYIQLKKQYLLRQQEILQQLKDKVDYKLPPRDVASEYKIIDSMPLTSIGKVDYKALEEKEKQLVLRKSN